MDFISDEIEKLSGYPSSDFIQNQVRSYSSIMHPDDAPISNAIARESISNKTPYTLEYRIIHADGQERWVYEKGQGIFDQGGTVKWLDGVIIDITKHKGKEEEKDKLFNELKDAFSKIKTLSEMLPICAYCKKIRDDEGYWNQIEGYISSHSETQFSHGICPECKKIEMEKLENDKT